jgi:hypothetical protein
MYLVLSILLLGSAYAGIRGRLETGTSDAQPSLPDVVAGAGDSLRGGVRKRMREPMPPGDDSCPAGDSHAMKKDWAKVVINSRQVQEYSANGQIQRAVGVDKLPAAGTHGAAPGSIHRSLMSLFGRPPRSPDVDWVPLHKPG